jgi:hypothetical protein
VAIKILIFARSVFSQIFRVSDKNLIKIPLVFQITFSSAFFALDDTWHNNAKQDKE